MNKFQHEIDTLNNPKFKCNANWLQMLTQMIEDHQDDQTPDGIAALARWNRERDELRLTTKMVFNEQFGSVFRTYHNPTYFSRRLFRFSDIYTADVCNLLNYTLTHTFYPRRGVMPHEYSSYFM